MSIALILVAALVVDGIVGEPRWFYRYIPHPVVLMGKLLSLCETYLNNTHWSDRMRRALGSIVLVASVLLMLFIGVGLEQVLSDTAWGDIALILIASSLIAGRSLYDHVRDVAVALDDETGLQKARLSVGRIIGRNTDELDEPAISRAALESLSENFSDGVVAPAFWFLIGGLPGILIYKMVNTADSMIGYRSERYLAFGWASARFDDLLNLVPARLTAVTFALASVIWGRTYNVLMISLRDSKHHISPNAGWPEAAMAGALNIKLGGPRQYPGNVIVDGVWLGSKDGIEATRSHIAQGLWIALISWAMMVAAIILWGM